MADPSPPAAHLADWLARGAAGDEAACAALYAQFSPAVLRLALGLLSDLQDAEEVAQDAFVYALRNLGRYDPARSAFSTWLYTITLSRCRNKRRRKWLALLPLERAANDRRRQPDHLIESVLERRGVRAQVWQALQALPPRLREPVALRYLLELRYKEIGATLGCNPKTAESRTRQGLQALRVHLRALGVEPESELTEQWV
ncbi:MAG: sigma-70 family RNA polymerase sigma factor [Anaerolineales bacterium]|nr:sigma-70 family RNA polymerase sigma factor [Anaerolineales bacterium]